MKHGFSVEVLTYEEIHELPGVWTTSRYRELLEHLDFDDFHSIADSDLAEMAAMAAQDKGLRDASSAVLEFVLGDRVSSGIQQNLVHELTDDRPWEQFSDLPHQVRIFETVEFLQRAFPSDFGIPDAAQVRARLTATGKEETAWLEKGPTPSLLLRLLAGAMDERATIRRLYADPLEAAPFPEAASILWQMAKSDETRGDNATLSCEVTVLSSIQWLGPLKESEGVFDVVAAPDPGV